MEVRIRLSENALSFYGLGLCSFCFSVVYIDLELVPWPNFRYDNAVLPYYIHCDEVCADIVS